MSEEKTQAQQLKEKLFYSQKNAFETLPENVIADAYAYCDDYKKFLDGGKTELLCTREDRSPASVLPPSKYRVFTFFRNSAESHHGSTRISPRTPCVPTILPASRNCFFMCFPRLCRSESLPLF